jgi:hypothetical protein
MIHVRIIASAVHTELRLLSPLCYRTNKSPVSNSLESTSFGEDGSTCAEIAATVARIARIMVKFGRLEQMYVFVFAKMPGCEKLKRS